MADTLVSLADLAKLNDMNARDMGVTDVFNAAPLLATLAATIATNGTTHSYLKESAAPVVGFRAVNAGRARTVSADTLVTVTLKVLDASYHVDQAIANSFTKGGPAALMAREGMRHLRAALRKAESQILNGDDAAGFDGMADVLDDLAHAMVITAAGGATDDRTSVYALRSTPDETDVVVVLGQDGRIDIGEFYESLATDGDGNSFDVFAQSIMGWMGLQVGGAKSMARLANVGAAKPLTDALMSNLYELFPEEAPPTHFAMNRFALGQLRNSRTATNATGAEAPYPTEWNGIPIVVTSGIGSNETAVVAA